ncbi:hypothetical protein CO230_03825 [Chryseobacterium sp. 6424]|uniref:hypothetical protein n=1 Tax=Chryseobacterium sp. 6424 TaxID=2039166 RepID=UPI000EFC02CD|nr:hypothetical protein [Chryseobacterium sp. 6424]AYO57327.1 hypothetical protein CO230_03825 [Chryseobacterium sp. 6424]
MSYFNTLLAEKNIDKNTLRSFRELRLTDDEFERLKAEICNNTRISALDPRDAGLYYAFWWQKKYFGGKPSKQNIFNSLGNSYFSFDAQDFYKHAKKGAKQLGIKWLQKQNTLFFRTLLTQGGLPIRHLGQNYNYYDNFLNRILELRPESIEDFAYDPDIIGILPVTLRNEIIYESCLEIVQAIWNEDPAYTNIFAEQHHVQRIIRGLVTKKSRLGNVVRKSSIKSNWILTKEEDKYRINLQIQIPKTLEQSSLLGLFPKLNSEDLDKRYSFFVGDTLIAELIQNISGNYNAYWHRSQILWDPYEILPEVFITDNKGEKWSNTSIINTLPSIETPMLWGQVNEYQWILEKSNKTKAEAALVLFSNGFETSNYNFIEVNGVEFRYVDLKNSVIISNTDGDVEFKTGQPSLDYIITGDKPDWMLRSNIPVVTGSLKVLVFDENGNSLPAESIIFRKNNDAWNDYPNTLPLGILEIEITKDGISERDFVYNIGRFSLDMKSADTSSAVLRFAGENFGVSINENPLCNYRIGENRNIQIGLKDHRKIPKSIKCSFKFLADTKSLLTEISSPFRGLELLNSDGEILDDKSVLLLNNLYGLRILNRLDSRIFVRFKNTFKDEIKISRLCNGELIPVNSFLEDFKKLFLLSDVLNPETAVTLELCTENFDESLRVKKQFFVRKYSNAVSKEFVDGSLRLRYVRDSENDLFAVPLDCNASQISTQALVKEENNNFEFGMVNPEIQKFILFSSSDNTEERVLPLFISANEENIETSDDDRLERVEKHKTVLLNEAFTDESWQKFINYFFICKANDLPYSTFDILKTVTICPEIAAKSFFFLRMYNPEEEFLYQTLPIFENDLGFSYHWLSSGSWHLAMNWIKNPKIYLDDLGQFLGNSVANSNFMHIPLNFFYGTGMPEFAFPLGSKIYNLRMSLGARVISEIPTICPKVSEEYKNIIPVNKDNAFVKILLKSPVAVAQSIKDRDNDIWDNSFRSDTVRRNIKYSTDLNPEWFTEALIYSLQKMQ